MVKHSHGSWIEVHAGTDFGKASLAGFEDDKVDASLTQYVRSCEANGTTANDNNANATRSRHILTKAVTEVSDYEMGEEKRVIRDPRVKAVRIIPGA